MKNISVRTTRRDFFADIPRLLILGGLASITGRLLGRSAGRDPAAHRCTGDSFCRDCSAMPQCVLPLAQSYRTETRKINTRGTGA